MNDKKKTIYDVIKEFVEVPDERDKAVKFQLISGIADLILAFFKHSSDESLKKITKIAKGEDFLLNARIAMLANLTLEVDEEMLHSNDGLLPINHVGEYMGAILALNLNGDPTLDTEVKVE